MSKHYSKGLIFSLLACVASPSYADVVSVESAKQVAAEFFSACSQERLASADALELVYTSGSASRPFYYVFNAREGKGFIIVSAEDCTTPVLGYSVDNSYNASSAPAAMKWMMSGLENEIKAAPSLQRRVDETEFRRMARKAGRGTYDRILLATPSWSQEAPFNNSIPGHPLVGCVGTAMGMIMKYHEYPERGTGSYNGVNFDVAYDWDNMRMDNYRAGYSQAEADAVSTLLYHTATSIGTQFGFSGSSAYEVKVPAAMINYFGYDPGISYKKRSEVSTQAEFDRLVAEDIKAGRPVLYCGQDLTAGHAFVVDGFDPVSNMIHVNWGWAGADGNNNGGWYASTALNPNVSQQHSFNNLTTIIYNIKPGNGKNSMWSPIHITADGSQEGMCSDLTGALESGKSFTVRVGNLKNLSYERFSGKIAVALFSAEGEFKSLLSNPDGFTLDGMALFSRAYADFSCKAPSAIEVGAEDVIRMATSSDNGATWLPLAGELITVNELPVKGNSPLYFTVGHTSPLADATFRGADRVIRGWDYTFSVVPSYPDRDVVTVKANGYMLTPDQNYNYRISNVLSDQNIAIYVQRASEVKEKRSIWVGEPGTLSTLIDDADAGTIKDLTLFGTIDARDFAFMRSSMKLTRLDISSVYIAANGTSQANAIPREAFRGLWGLKNVILPNNINRINNGAFRLCGITEIVIPAGVKTYEYNVFNGSSGLRHVWVGNPNAAFVNWCVFSGTNTAAMTLHCPSQSALESYSNKEYWKDIANKVVETYPAQTDLALALMENPDVKFESETEAGRYAPGTKVVFKAEHIADNDDRMVVYANATPLTPDAQGNYAVTLNRNTIIHFDLIKPIAASAKASPWQLTDDGGTVGLLTDVVNVIPGVEFTIRANSFRVTDRSVFWAAVLTDANGGIKEFISPINTMTGAAASGLKMNINCCVREATVREGNFIRLATSFNQKEWSLVEGINDNVIDALPAINNQTPVYSFTFPEGIRETVNLSGIVESAVHGRDLTFRMSPKDATNVLTVKANGIPIAGEAKSVAYSFIAKENLDFEIAVTKSKKLTEIVFDLKEGERLWDPNDFNQMRSRFMAANGKQRMVVKGKIDKTDFDMFKHAYFASQKFSVIDLSEAQIVADRKAPASYIADEFPSNAFWATTSPNKNLVNSLKEVKLPATVKRIGMNAMEGCAEITEIELPLNLYNDATVYFNGKDRPHQGGLKKDCFKGCNKLTTIYCYAAPEGDKVHHIDFNYPSTWNGNTPDYYPNNLGLSDCSKVTVVVKPEYLAKYKKPHSVDWNDWHNGWVINGFNILGEYPVYGVNFETTRCFVPDKNVDINRFASFLGDNVKIESLAVGGKLHIGVKSQVTSNRPAGVDAYVANAKVKVYDNGKLLPDDAVAQDGSVTLTYYNPNRYPEKSGNHNVNVVYLYDVNFACTSSNFVIEPETVRNNENLGDAATEFEYFNYYDAVAPVLESVKEESQVRFKVNLRGVDASQVSVMVKIGENVILPDESGYYSVDVADSNVNVNVFAVPRNGAVLNPAEVDVISPAEANNVTSISFAGDVDSDKLKEVIDKFPAIEEVDLSELTVALPAGAMAGKETLKGVVLPEASDIEAGTFSGCTGLMSVTVPESVDYIGADAFSGCSSLESLSFTGIKAVGANAFAGCDNLTTIIFNSQKTDAPARARRKAESTRPADYSADAFKGLNPNCIIYIDENEEVPAAKANYVTVRSTQDADGKMERVYEATGSIYLDGSYPFNAINTFSVPNGNIVSCCMDLKASDGKINWRPLLLPFSPTRVIDASGNEMIIYIGPDCLVPDQNYMVGTVSRAFGDGFMLTNTIKANEPNVVSLHAATFDRTVYFVADNGEVVRTPEDMRRKCVDYDLVGTFDKRELPGSRTYKLNDAGSSFVSDAASLYAETVDNADVRTEVAPFSVYVEADPGRVFDINIDPGITTGADGAVADGMRNGLRIERDGDMLVIYSDCARSVELFGVDGMLIKVVVLSEGRNTIGGLANGVYILDGMKVVI